MNYEEKIEELTKRVEFLEKKEHYRTIKKRIKLSLNIIKILIVIFILFKIYTYIKPYKEKIDNIDTKLNTVENFVKENWNSIQKYNIFN